MTVDITAAFAAAEATAPLATTPHMNGMSGSSILKIAGEVAELKAQGRTVYNLTIGDFDPSVYPVPSELVARIQAALDAGQTNYPPAVGVPELRRAIVDFYRRELDLDYPIDSVLVGSGARPPIYAAFAALVDEGDTVLYPVPSWNVNHYAYLNKAKGVPLGHPPRDGLHAHPRHAGPPPEHRAHRGDQQPAEPLGHGHRPRSARRDLRRHPGRERPPRRGRGASALPPLRRRVLAARLRRPHPRHPRWACVPRWLATPS